jgi:Domain of unknown function (DUF5916)/Carbohydrate family 9 binding domain-like
MPCLGLEEFEMRKQFKLVVVLALTIMFIINIHLTAKQKTEDKNIPKRKYTTKRNTGNPIVIDGKIDDEAWQTVSWSGGFIQRSPYEGKPPSQDTQIKILYDDENIYVGIRAFDTEPDKIENRLARRDNFAGDWVEINIDSYFDHRTAFSFTLSVSGVKGDEAISNNGHNWDSSWNPIWYGKTKIDDKGWTGEMRIPLSQIRFGNKEKQVWGLQFTRRVFRKEERSCWQVIPTDSPGWVHMFGELHGIEGIQGQRQVELYPYAVAKYQSFEKEEGNPFADGNSFGFSPGLDGKIGVTSDLTLDFTINPDFGQVEADPSEVNLTAFETFFRERRPFFIEGKNILDFSITGGGGGFSRDNLFYSRRIGRSPSYYPDLEDDQYVNFPENTKIMAAAKLTGKTKKGLSIAIMNSITSQETAEIDHFGERRSVIVEPFSNYFALRMQKDFRGGSTRIGGMVTSTNRNIQNSELNFLHDTAYTGGFDFYHDWKKKTYYVKLNTVFSFVQGTKTAILETQESSRRYFQRPDADHVTLDPSRTSLSGHGGTIAFGKDGSGGLRYSGGFTWRSPGLELNDIGFLRAADRTMQWIWVGYRVFKPFAIFREMGINLNQYQGWDFGGTHLFSGGNINTWGMLKNYFRFGFGAEREFGATSVSELRGGPAILYPGGWHTWFDFSSDHRKKIRYSWRISNSNGDSDYYDRTSTGFSLHIQPSNALVISLSPSLTWNKRTLQYIDTLDYNGDPRYLFGLIKQKTAALTLRIDYSITPEMTIQFYGQPFISAGKYSQLKYITDPKADSFNNRFSIFNENQLSYDTENDQYTFDENSDGTIDYSVEQPNFNFLQFRSNLVFRWEYKPGSIVYLVWSQGRTGTDINGNFSFSNDFRDLFKIKPHNVFLVKFTHRFNL